MKQVIIRPHVTEKSLALAAKGYYSFVVANSARKEEIKSAIHALYSVQVLGCRTTNLPGKTRRAGRGRTKVVGHPWKKAMVRLKPGETIDAFETTKEEEKK